jgi:hypothetical protein
MSKDEKQLPATRNPRDEIARRLDGTARALDVRNPISGFFHRIGSTVAKRALDDNTAETEAFSRNMNAQSDAVRSMLKLRDTVDEYRARDELADLSYANTRARLSDTIAEEEHQRTLSEARRRRQLEEAGTEHIEAQRKKFTAEQGFENQQRLKDRNLRIWEKRREAQELDAHVETERVRTELRGDTPPAVPQSSMESMRAKAEEALMTALADGNDAEVERWQRVLDALGE